MIVKTAISIPDNIFKAADNAAKKLGISRSELYARAVKDFIDYRDGESVTDTLNRIYGSFSSTLDDELSLMQSEIVTEEEW
jgi:metal-responsive CopG/Arc/MetJ family transcriptional regulator